MIVPLGRAGWVGIGAALAGAGMALGLSLALLLANGPWPRPVRAPYPGVRLVAERISLIGPAGVEIVREYEVQASLGDVAEWYQGKDSLMPLPSVIRVSCFAHDFQREIRPLRPILRGTEEAVTVCRAARAVTITSVLRTSLRLPLRYSGSPRQP